MQLIVSAAQVCVGAATIYGRKLQPQTQQLPGEGKMKTSTTGPVRVLVCMMGFLLVMSALSQNRLLAQVATASISGIATDSSGAALAGAKIRATNIGTGIAQNTVTDAQGRYTIPELAVGTYTVQASQTGFQTVIRPGITLSVGGNSVVDFSLPVGQMSQTVNVEANVSQVETQTSEISSLVTPQQMRDLPLNGRNYEQLITLAPGVVTLAAYNNPVTGRIYGMQNNYSISGSRPTGQAFMMDNTDVRDFWEHGVGSGYAGTSLGVEAIAEFQVLTNTYDAQFPGNGVVVNSVTRSGTNDLHGGAYEFLRNSALDARDFQDPDSGPPPFRRNQFGVAIGGPIKKDKLFFFSNYEGLRQSLASTISGFTILEPYVAQGMLPCADITPTPATCTPSTSANSSQPGVLIGTVPSANPAAEQVAALYGLCKACTPVPSFVNGSQQPAGFDQGGYYSVVSAPPLVVNEDYILGRVDYDIRTNDSMFARYLIDDARVDNNPQDPLGIFPELDFTRNQYLTITERHIFSPTMVNSLHFGFVRSNENSHTALGLSAAQMSAAGLASDPLDFTRTLFSEPFRPDGQVNPFSGAGTSPVGPNPDRPEADIQDKFSGGDDLVWTHGSHSLKIGGVVTRVQFNIVHVAYSAGTNYIDFTTMQNYVQGSPLLGFATPQGFANSTRYFRELDIAPYIQDDWKVTSRLTLNLGMRYDYGTNPVGWSYGNTPLTTIAASYLPPTGPLSPPSVTSNPASLFTPVKHAFLHSPNADNWAPRVGFAYDPFADHKTSIRGGFGIFHDPVAVRTYESGFVATPPAISDFLVDPGFPNAFTGFALPPSEYAGVDYLVPHGSPYTIQYNLNVQREVAPGTVFTIGYVGSVSRHLWGPRDINPPLCLTYPDCTALPQIPKSYPSASNATYTVNDNVANPGTCVGSDPLDPAQPQQTCYGSGAQFPPAPGSAGPRINPDFGAVTVEATTGASSFNSLQTGLTHQFGKNLSGQVYYTWSHCVDNGSFTSGLELPGQAQSDGYNQAYDYENCIFDVRHNLSVNGLYSLPFTGSQLAEGWRLGAIFGVHSGQPVNITNGEPSDPGSLQTATRPNYSFAPGCSPNHIVDKAVAPGVLQWFDPSCYEPQAPGFLGNVRRNSVPGPGAFNLDFSITKDTTIHENFVLQFRAEFFNIMNHFNPGPPSGLIDLANGTDGQTRTSQAPVITPRQIQFAVKLDF
jgi:Carboxypeptidase regulatory-like domain/TonB dependent receptor-like, beta-barrel